MTEPASVSRSWLVRLADHKYWWIGLTIGIALLIAGWAVLTALGGHLTSMHAPGHVGRGLDQSFGLPHLDEAVKEWKTFWDPVDGQLRQAIQNRFRSPLSIVVVSLVFDWVLLIPGYAVAGLIILARNHKRTKRPHLRPVFGLAAGALIVAALADVLENVFKLWMVWTYWGDRGVPRFVVYVLGALTNTKTLLLLGAFLALFLAVITRVRDRKPATGRAVRLLRIHIVVTFAAVLIFMLPIQVTDLVLRLSWNEAFALLLIALLLALSTWSLGRLLVSGYESRKPPAANRMPPLWLLIAVFGPLLAVGAVNAATGDDPLGPLIPIGMALVVFLLGLPLRRHISDQRSTTRSLGIMGVALPLALAGLSLMAGGVAASRAAVASYIQQGPFVVPTVVGVILFLGPPALIYGLVQVERRLDARCAGTIGDRTLIHLIARIRRGQRERLRAFARIACVLAVLVAILYALMVAFPIPIPQAFGAPNIALLFLTSLSLALGGLSLLGDWWTDRFGVPEALKAFDFRRVPVITLLVVWAFLSALVDDGSHWDIRTLDSGSAPDPQPGMSLQTAFDTWIESASPRAADAVGDGRRSIPLVIVGSSGGGVRAAYWTALAMDCLFSGHKATTTMLVPDDPCAPTTGRPVAPADVFAASGISGSSVGLVEWDASRDIPWSGTWVEDSLGEDFVAPVVARGLLIEMPRSLLHFGASGRDDILEQAWERPWEADGSNPLQQGFLTGQAERAKEGGPFLVLNGSSVFDGCELNVSVIDMGSTVDQRAGNAPSGLTIGDCSSVARYLTESGGEPPGPLPLTIDLVDYLGCPTSTDIRRSTAALLSARFPYVSAAGRLEACATEASTRFIVDGGYIDTSGAETAMAIWFALEPFVQGFNISNADSCVIPYFVQLDNGYLETGSPRDRTRPPNQLLAPAQALLQTTGLESRASRARAMAAAVFGAPFSLTGPPSAPAVDGPGAPSGRYAILKPVGHPGLEAPLGWALAEQSRRDLEEQLYRVNADAIREVRGWLEHPPACPPAPS